MFNVHWVNFHSSKQDILWRYVTYGPFPPKNILITSNEILPEQLEYNYEPIAPAVSGYFDNIGKSIGELKSDSFQTKAEQFGLQQSLDAQDREAAYERGDTNWFQKQAAGVTDTLSNMASVPEMITDTAANAAGSLIPFAAAAQATSLAA